MDNEFNDLSTDNIQTTFTLDTENTATSDELEADPVYTNKMGTAYSIGKGISKAVAAAGITLSVSAGGILMMNSFVSPPAISETRFEASAEDDSFLYSFTIKNDKSYKATFDVKDEEDKIVFTLDVTKPDKYEGKVENLGYQKSYSYSIYYNNGIDVTSVLTDGTFKTKEKQS